MCGGGAAILSTVIPNIRNTRDITKTDLLEAIKAGLE
jgi:hypothetical protein